MQTNWSGWPRGTSLKDDERSIVVEMGEKDCRPGGGRDRCGDAGQIWSRRGLGHVDN